MCKFTLQSWSCGHYHLSRRTACTFSTRRSSNVICEMNPTPVRENADIETTIDFESPCASCATRLQVPMTVEVARIFTRIYTAGQRVEELQARYEDLSNRYYDLPPNTRVAVAPEAQQCTYEVFVEKVLEPDEDLFDRDHTGQQVQRLCDAAKRALRGDGARNINNIEDGDRYMMTLHVFLQRRQVALDELEYLVSRMEEAASRNDEPAQWRYLLGILPDKVSDLSRRVEELRGTFRPPPGQADLPLTLRIGCVDEEFISPNLRTREWDAEEDE
ncbi:hypothetical protein H2201_003678 [Coniosporium apollinis]|uniref:Uncharacterized protein n=1 Tax=Coniosporium apollinis TaxID=61459 RepID=A0ABQ9NY67_9PEZI|nr:hypothetical protein H2201_003678 [Coniosporium apollinis]